MKQVFYGATGKALGDMIAAAVVRQLSEVGLELYNSREDEHADRDEGAVDRANANFDGIVEYTVTVEVAE